MGEGGSPSRKREAPAKMILPAQISAGYSYPAQAGAAEIGVAKSLSGATEAEAKGAPDTR